MKKLLICALALALLLCGCGGSSDPDLLEYPGVKWNMTLDEVQSVLGFSDGDIVEEYTSEPSENSLQEYTEYQYQVSGLTMFEQESRTMILTFHAYPGHEPGLAQIEIFYPDGYDGTEAADLAALEAKLTELYGQRATRHVLYNWAYWEGEMQDLSEDYPEDKVVWLSRTTQLDLMSKDQLESMYTLVTDRWTANGYGDNLPTMEEYRQTIDVPLASIDLRQTFSYFSQLGITDEDRAMGFTDYVLSMSGTTYISALYLDRYFE